MTLFFFLFEITIGIDFMGGVSILHQTITFVSFLWRWNGFRLKVRIVEEFSEQKEVAAVHSQWILEIRPVHCAWNTIIEHMGGIQVYSKSNDHLWDLQEGYENVDFSWDFELQCAKRVVRVHQTVDEVVDQHEPATATDSLGIRIPHIQENGNMVIVMKENKWLFPENNKNSVTEFKNLGNGK